MSCTTTKIKSGDTAITWSDTLTEDDVAINLTNVTQVLFLLRGNGDVFSGVGVIDNAVTGEVSYVPGGSFPTAPGVYKQEWELTFSDSTIVTVPSTTYNQVKIIDDLN